MIIILADWKCQNACCYNDCEAVLYEIRLCMTVNECRVQIDQKNNHWTGNSKSKIRRNKNTHMHSKHKLQQYHLYDFYDHFFVLGFQPVANNKIDSCMYEMITVHRHAANYELINNRISDTE